MRSDRDSDSYESLFVQFSDLAERWMIRILLSLVLFLLVAQTLLRISSVRILITKVDRLEGSPFVQKSSDSFDQPFAKND